MVGRIEYNVWKFNSWLDPSIEKRQMRLFKYSSTVASLYFIEQLWENSKWVLLAHLQMSAKNHATKSIFNKFIRYTIRI